MSERNDFLTLAQHLTDKFEGFNKPNNRLDSFPTVFIVLHLDKSNKLIYKTYKNLLFYRYLLTWSKLSTEKPQY